MRLSLQPEYLKSSLLRSTQSRLGIISQLTNASDQSKRSACIHEVVMPTFKGSKMPQ